MAGFRPPCPRILTTRATLPAQPETGKETDCHQGHVSGVALAPSGRVKGESQQRPSKAMPLALRWSARYGRSDGRIRLIGWDAEPQDPVTAIRRRGDGEGRGARARAASSDLALLRHLCARTQPMAEGQRFGMVLVDRRKPDHAFVEALGDILADTGFPPHALRLVLSEDRLSDEDRSCALSLAVLVDWGIELWMGRFGQDPTSLSLLRDRAASGILAGVSLDISLLTGQSGIWRGLDPVRAGHEGNLDLAAKHFYSATCHGLQALGLKTHLSRISAPAHFEFAVSAGFDEYSGSCPALTGIVQDEGPPCF